MRPRSAVAIASFALALSALLPPSADAADASIVNVGWWSQRPGAAELPAGGFELALGPAGPLSRAALRIQVDAPLLTSALLELTESDAAGAEVAAVQVCPAATQWAPANPGPWEDAPEANCSRNIPLSRRSTGEWAGDISVLLGSGTTAVALMPMSNSNTEGIPVPYQIVFSKATLQASAPEQVTPAPSPPAFDDFESEPSQPRVIAAPDSPPSGSGTGPPPVVVEPKREASDADDEFAPTLATDDDERGRPKPWWRLAILVPVAALLGAGAIFARRTASERGWTG